jgi:hypothetical protein
MISLSLKIDASFQLFNLSFSFSYQRKLRWELKTNSVL